jgi:hypothetical protein
LKTLLRSAGKLLGSCKRWVGVKPFDMFAFLDYVDGFDDEGFIVLRTQALIWLRITSLLRPGEPATIVRSSIKTQIHPVGHRVVTFVYKSKQSVQRDNGTDANYVEFITADHIAHRCPASAILKLKNWVDALPNAMKHDALFTDIVGNPISRTTLGAT